MMWRVEICGGIASGKTTLARLLCKIGLQPIYEDFARNPFWEAFNRNPTSCGLETEISFVLQHYHDAAAERARRGMTVCDYSFILDLAYSDVTLLPEERVVFLEVWEHVRERLRDPLLLVYLRCPSKEELARIRRRRRSPEEGIGIEYLEALDAALAHRVSEIRGSIETIEIDSGARNFATDDREMKAVTEEIGDALQRRRARVQ